MAVHKKWGCPIKNGGGVAHEDVFMEVHTIQYFMEVFGSMGRTIKIFLWTGTFLWGSELLLGFCLLARCNGCCGFHLFPQDGWWVVLFIKMLWLLALLFGALRWLGWSRAAAPF